MLPGPAVGLVRESWPAGSCSFQSPPPTTLRAPLGSGCSRGPPEHYQGRKPSGLKEQHPLSGGAALLSNACLAPGPGPLWKDKADTGNNPTTISPLSPFFFIVVIITFQTLQLLWLVIAGEAFGQSSWGPPLPSSAPPHPHRPSFTAVSLTKYIKPILIG